MQSALYEAEHDAFRAMVRDFLAKEVVPHHAAWEEAGVVDRSIWLRAGEQGLLGMDVPEQYGGGGVKDFRYNAILSAECSSQITSTVPRGVYFTPLVVRFSSTCSSFTLSIRINCGTSGRTMTLTCTSSGRGLKS